MATSQAEIPVYHRRIEQGRGDGFVVTIPTVVDGGYDITGYTYACEIETKARANVATYTITVDTIAQTVTFTLAHGVTSGITVGSYVYDVKESPATGSPRTLFRGTVNVSAPVTD